MTYEDLALILVEVWNSCVTECIAIVCPTPHVEEERTCEEIKAQLERLRK